LEWESIAPMFDKLYPGGPCRHRIVHAGNWVSRSWWPASICSHLCC